MPRPIKFDDSYEKVEHWTKLFMYNNPAWNNISPIVEIIRNLDKHCYIAYKYGKGQNTIKLYSSQYNHRILGCDLKKGDDYIQNIVHGFVKFIFIFSDSTDSYSTNLINIAKKYKICAICYSNFDSIYYFYNYSIGESVIYKFNTAIEVIGIMKELTEYTSFKRIVDIFPEFDIIPEVINNSTPVLERCLQLLRETSIIEECKKESKKIKKVTNKPFYDANLNKLKKHEYIRKNKVCSIPDVVSDPITPTPKQKMLLSQFFKKK